MNKIETGGSKTLPWYGISTSLTIGLALVVCITGLMLFLKLAVPVVKEAHEWLSVAFVIAVVAHAIRHRRVLVRYATVRSFWFATIAVLAATACFVVPSLAGGQTENPMMATIGLLGAARIEQVAQMAKTSEDVLMERLRSGGVNADSPQDTLDALAQSAGRRVPDLLAIMLAKPMQDHAR